MNVLDLFSGIGGFSVGLEATGKFKTIGFCEQDKFCQKVLRKHWSNVPIYEDIKKLDARKIKADVVVGGFPCQSISIAGKQKGKDDDRNLWPDVAKLIRGLGVPIVFLENGPGILRYYWDNIRPELREMGYEVTEGLFSAAETGAPHKRQRIFILAYSRGISREKEVS